MSNTIEHILLTALGTSSRETTYTLNARYETAGLSPIALMKLLLRSEKPSRVLALCTEEAKIETFPILSGGVDVQCIPLDIPVGKNEHEAQEILRTILKSIPENSILTLELTHGLRHFPFLFFTSALYLSALKNVSIRGAWYGMYDAKDESGNAPFVDLSVLLEMAEWFQAVRIFRDFKNASSLVDMFRKKIDEWSPDEVAGRKVKNDLGTFMNWVERFNYNYGAGLPLELGKSAQCIEDVFRKKISGIGESGSELPSIPLFGELLSYIVDASTPFVFPEPASSKGNWKQAIPADESELMRQLNLVESYLENGLLNNAIGLMRELVISRVSISMGYNSTHGSWLSKDGRYPPEKKLGALISYAKDSSAVLPDPKKELARCWDSITQRRNELHHHGMNKVEVNIEKSVSELKGVWETIKENFESDASWNPEFGGGGGKLLISPLGLSPGLLYTALKTVSPPPDRCLVLTSKEGERNLKEILGKTEYDGTIHLKFMEKPHDGFEEIPSIVKECEELLVNADEIVCNVTGGTTAIQWAISRLAERAKNLSRDVSRVAMVDRRSYEKQKKNPYVKGELIRLDG